MMLKVKVHLSYLKLVVVRCMQSVAIYVNVSLTTSLETTNTIKSVREQLNEMDDLAEECSNNAGENASMEDLDLEPPRKNAHTDACDQVWYSLI